MKLLVLVQTYSLSFFHFFGLMTLQSVERWKWVGESIGDRVENKKDRERALAPM